MSDPELNREGGRGGISGQTETAFAVMRTATGILMNLSDAAAAPLSRKLVVEGARRNPAIQRSASAGSSPLRPHVISRGERDR